MKTVPWPHSGPHDTDVMPFLMVESDPIHSKKDPGDWPSCSNHVLAQNDIHRQCSTIILHSRLFPLQ